MPVDDDDFDDVRVGVGVDVDDVGVDVQRLQELFRIEIGRLDAFLLLSIISQLTYFPLSGGIWIQVRLFYEKEALEVLVSEVDLDPKIWVRILLSSLFENFRVFLTFIRVDTFSRTIRIAWHKTYYITFYHINTCMSF